MGLGDTISLGDMIPLQLSIQELDLRCVFHILAFFLPSKRPLNKTSSMPST